MRERNVTPHVARKKTGSVLTRELGQLRKLRTQLKAAELLVIDDLFLRRLPAGAGDEFADVLMSRYEKASTIITSNRGLDDWAKLLGDVWSSSARSSIVSCTTDTCSSSTARVGA